MAEHIIKRWTDGGEIWKGEAYSLAEAIFKAYKSGADLSWADLSRADLSRADLSRADLSRANLSRANLSGADLSWADLSRANLSGANLSGANLSGADLSWADLSWADLSWANLSGANLSWADLSWADLSWADLSWANLSWADLSWANLSGANLSWANLSGANLSRAKGVQPEKCTPLLLLLDQPGPIRLYKLVTAHGVGPYNGGITYEVGKSYEVFDANTDISEQCGAGISVATLDWCLREWQEGWRVLVVEFTAKDIAAIPTTTDGKIRLFRCSVVAEKDITALVAKPKAKAV